VQTHRHIIAPRPQEDPKEHLAAFGRPSNHHQQTTIGTKSAPPTAHNLLARIHKKKTIIGKTAEKSNAVLDDKTYTGEAHRTDKMNLKPDLGI